MIHFLCQSASSTSVDPIGLVREAAHATPQWWTALFGIGFIVGVVWLVKYFVRSLNDFQARQQGRDKEIEQDRKDRERQNDDDRKEAEKHWFQRLDTIQVAHQQFVDRVFNEQLKLQAEQLVATKDNTAMMEKVERVIERLEKGHKA